MNVFHSTLATLPDAVDWKAKGYVTEVGSQVRDVHGNVERCKILI